MGRRPVLGHPAQRFRRWRSRRRAAPSPPRPPPFLTADGPDHWTITFDDVLVGVEQRFRINHPNNCDLNATGATTTGITANGVTLTREVGKPGNGIEPGALLPRPPFWHPAAPPRSFTREEMP
jgi:hypothetical protein